MPYCLVLRNLARAYTPKGFLCGLNTSSLSDFNPATGVTAMNVSATGAPSNQAVWEVNFMEMPDFSHY